MNDIGSSYVVGIGVGTRFSPMFRGDIVYSYRGGYELMTPTNSAIRFPAIHIELRDGQSLLGYPASDAGIPRS